MKIRKRKCISIFQTIATSVILISFIYFSMNLETTNFTDEEQVDVTPFPISERNQLGTGVYSTIPLAMVLCRDVGNTVLINKKDTRLEWTRQREQFLTMFASLLYLSDLPQLTVILFTDTIETAADLISLMDKWPKHQRDRLIFIHRDLEMERFKRKNLSQWRPCAWAKMFLPEMLPDYDSVIYIDSDIVFLGPVEDLWGIFPRMNKTQSIAAAPELWYIEEGNIRPTAGQYGINTGVLALNLTRLRHSLDGGLGTTLQMLPNLNPQARHDQDVLNAFLETRPELLLELPARYNFLPSSCLKLAPLCTECLQKGILVLHGADSIFYRLVDAKSREVYREFLSASGDLHTPLATIAANLEARLSTIEAKSPHLLFMCQRHQQYEHQLMLRIRNRTKQEE